MDIITLIILCFIAGTQVGQILWMRDVGKELDELQRAVNRCMR
jgi:hypothetical protein